MFVDGYVDGYVEMEMQNKKRPVIPLAWGRCWVRPRGMREMTSSVRNLSYTAHANSSSAQ